MGKLKKKALIYFKLINYYYHTMGTFNSLAEFLRSEVGAVICLIGFPILMWFINPYEPMYHAMERMQNATLAS